MSDDLVSQAKTVIRYFIDCKAVFFTPCGWSVESHKKDGLWKWNPRLRFYQSRKQERGSILGFDLRTELAGQSVLDANVLDYLLKYPKLIPKKWKGKKIFFWGTIYINLKGHACVRYIHWDGKTWNWYYYNINREFGPDCFAAMAN